MRRICESASIRKKVLSLQSIKQYKTKNMNAKLLQKVEELTLYVIDLQKQIDELKITKNT